MTRLLTDGWLLLLLVSAVAGVFGLILLYRTTRAARLKQGRDLAARVDLLEDQVVALRREIAGLRDGEPPARPAQAEPHETAYSQAMRLARQGLDSSAVALGCGISRGEAELIVALYRASPRQ